MSKKQDWVQSPGGMWRYRLPCGETVSAECAAEMGYGSPPEDAYVRAIEKNRELEEENRRLRNTISQAKKVLVKEQLP